MLSESAALFSTPKKAPQRLTVRPFCVATDTSIVFKWMSREFAGPLLTMSHPPQELEELYTSMIESDFAQPFMGLVNDTPVCQMDIYKTQQDIISLNYPARAGDFRLQLIVAPLTAQDNMIVLLRTCLEHFFSFPEVGRIIVDMEAGDIYLRQLFKKMGFRSLHEVRGAYGSSSLYVCTAGLFRQTHAAAR
jgi:hypothetical protein